MTKKIVYLRKEEKIIRKQERGKGKKSINLSLFLFSNDFISLFANISSDLS